MRQFRRSLVEGVQMPVSGKEGMRPVGRLRMLVKHVGGWGEGCGSPRDSVKCVEREVERGVAVLGRAKVFL